MEFNNSELIPEQKLWKAVLNQALQDAFNDTYYTKNDYNKQMARDWMKEFNLDFATVCENAGFNPKQCFNKIKKYNLVRSGIVSI